VRVFVAHAGIRQRWVGTRLLDHADEVCTLDVAGLADGPLASFDEHAGQLLLVCTHGRHDACCAERGRPVAAALAQEAPDETWEVSHIGGDRFAANVLALPSGHYYGRLEPQDAAGFVTELRGGGLDLEHLRGRTAYPFVVQAAEVALRRHLDERRDSAVRWVGRSDETDHSTVTFEVVGAGRWSVGLRSVRRDERLLTCRAASASSGTGHEVLDLTPL